MRIIGVALWVMIVLIVASSCNKKDTNSQTNCCTTPYPASLIIPYDTSGITDVFSANIIIDSSLTTNRGSIVYYASVTSLGDSGQVIVNGKSLTGNSGLLYARDNYTQDSTSTNFKVSWILKGRADIAYANTQPFPFSSILIPDTVSDSFNNIYYFYDTNTPHSDTSMLEIALPVNKDSLTTFRYYAASNGGNIGIPKEVLQSFSKKHVRLSLSAFSSNILIGPSGKYLFIKRYTQTKYVWVK